jgi:hypothetical protein
VRATVGHLARIEVAPVGGVQHTGEGSGSGVEELPL